MTTLGNFNNLSLLNKFANTSTGTGTVNLKTIDDGVDGNELHLPMSQKYPIGKTNQTYLRDFSKKLIVISLFEVNLVIDGITNLTLTPFLIKSNEYNGELPSFR